MNTKDETKNNLFKIVQDYLKPCPLIVWGSGATIPLGMPSMKELKTKLKIEEKGNLEEILSSLVDQNSQNEYEKGIFKIINQKDDNFRKSLLKDPTQFNFVKNLICYFYNPHPKLINIITTNYDCVLEYLFSYHNIPYSDGFLGREFSEFDESNFEKNNCINLYKVHGSLRWSNNRYSYYNSNMDAIYPSNEKYKKTSQEPYRTIISNADKAITAANCFLCIGFGFNDEHITPKIDEAIQQSKPIVVITKIATDSAKSKLNNAAKYVLIEKKDNETAFTYKKNGEKQTEVLKGNYWKIEQFNQILF